MPNPGFKKVMIDSSLLIHQMNADLSTILSQHSTIFVKSYGNGSLSTPSLRGTSSSHTQVEWNGISINSPMLGMTNLSQVPVSQVNNIEILYGPADIVQTNGAFGGVINLVTNPDWNNKLNIVIGQTVASFSSYTTDAGFDVGNRNAQSVTKINYSNATNDFLYYNEHTGSNQKQQNAQYSMGGFSEEAFFKFSNKYFLTTRLWYSENKTHIPPISANLNTKDQPVQEDRAIRSMIEGKILGKKNVLTLRTAMVDQFMNYTDSSANTNHQVYSWTNRVRWTYSGIKRLSFRPGVDINYDWVLSDAYDARKTRSNIGAFSEFIYSLNKKVEFTFVFRQDVLDGKFLPFIPGLGAVYRPFNKIDISLNANVSRNYRFPSLNDLYWSPYGNPDLKPEMDYAAEVSIIYKYTNRRQVFYLETELTGYYSKMIDLITWTPVSGNSTVWKPENISEVLARGLEAGLNLRWDVLKGRLSFDNNYSYCKSTSEKAKSPQDASLGKQLIYIPVHSLNSTLSLKRNEFYLSYNFQFVSKRYTGNDNETYMPAYYLSNLIFGKNVHLKKFIVSLQLQINNLFDLDYQSVVNRPMPGRNYAITLKFNISNHLVE
jgi:outer membrane cobalamin receptor